MSSYLFPYTLQGVKFDYIRKYLWNTGVQKAASGKQSTIAYQQYPLVNFEYSFEFLRDSNTPADLSTLVGLINAVRGRSDTFLHTDPDFNSIGVQTADGSWTADSELTADGGTPGAPFGTGDGSTKAFQLVVIYQASGGPGVAEIIQNLNGSPTIYSNGTPVPSNEYSVGVTGIVTFTTAPADGASLTWAGSWYYRCRFDADSYDFKKLYMGLWSADKISFSSVIL